MINHRLMAMGISSLTILGSLAGKGNAQTPNRQTSNTGNADVFRVNQSTGTACPPGNGIHISVTSGSGTVTSSGDSASRDTTTVNTIIDERHSIDTTIVFNTAQKTWTRTNLAAALTVGLQGQSHGTYSICAGVAALMPSATLTIRGARGTVHFAASFQDLLNSIRLGPGAQSPPPRRL